MGALGVALRHPQAPHPPNTLTNPNTNNLSTCSALQPSNGLRSPVKQLRVSWIGKGLSHGCRVRVRVIGL